MRTRASRSRSSSEAAVPPGWARACFSLLAGGAPLPEGGVGIEAAGAERLAQRSSLQRRPGPAARAGDPALAAPFAYRGAGRPRDADPAAVGCPADAAGQAGARAAGLADRPGCGDRGDAPLVAALRAGLPAARVAVPAVLADGLPAVVVAPGDGAHLPAPPEVQGPGLAAAPAADPESVGQAAEGPLPAAAGQAGSTTAVAAARASALMNRRTPGWPGGPALRRRVAAGPCRCCGSSVSRRPWP